MIENPKGRFFEMIIPPIECPQCKHPRRAFGVLRVCTFCGQKEDGQYVVCGRKLNAHDYHDFLEASDVIFAHLEHAKSIQEIATILREGIYIQSYALNIISAKAGASQQIVEAFAIKTNQIMLHLGLQFDKDDKFKPEGLP